MTQLVESELKTFEVPLGDIFCDENFNCRGAIVPRDVVDLARSIDSVGLQQPITLQPWDKIDGKKFRILSGHRRFCAFQLLSPPKPTIPAIINSKPLTELDARKLNLEENLKRKDLNILQEAMALKPFDAAGWTQEDMARELNQSKGWIQARMALLKLPEDIQQVAAAGLLTQEHIKQLASMKSRQAQVEAVKKIKDAKIAGDKKKIEVKPKKKDVLSKKKREPAEIFEMIELISNVIGFGFYTRTLAWSAGEISEYQLLRDLRDEAEKKGITYTIPAEILKQMEF